MLVVTTNIARTPSIYHLDAIYKSGRQLCGYFSWYRQEVENTTPQMESKINIEHRVLCYATSSLRIQINITSRSSGIPDITPYINPSENFDKNIALSAYFLKCCPMKNQIQSYLFIQFMNKKYGAQSIVVSINMRQEVVLKS